MSSAAGETKAGSLTVVGSGIRGLHQLTNEARGRIVSAEKVFYAVCDPFTEEWIQRNSVRTEDLCAFYAEGKDRRESYREMIEAMLRDVRAGLRVCAVFYGHPGVFVYPSHEAVRLAREEGYRAAMLPGISSEDCLYADLGVDPASHGCLSYEATDFVLAEHPLDPSCAVILWQVDCVGEPEYHEHEYAQRHVPVLVEALLRYYPADHEGILYTAPMLAVGKPKMLPVKLGALAETLKANPGYGTLYIPPAVPITIDLAMAARLGISPSELNPAREHELRDA